MDNGEKHQYIVPYEQEKKMKESEEKKEHHKEGKEFFDQEVVSIFPLKLSIFLTLSERFDSFSSPTMQLLP